LGYEVYEKKAFSIEEQRDGWHGSPQQILKDDGRSILSLAPPPHNNDAVFLLWA